MKPLEPGYYWVRDTLNGYWEFVELRLMANQKELEVWVMGWDIPEPLSNFKEFIKTELVTPDGEVRSKG